MFKKSVIFGLAMLLYLFSGCSSTKGPKDKENPYTYVAKAGKATMFDFKRETPKILNSLFYYQIVRTEETSDQIYYETNWQYRTPFEDEALLGIAEARSMIIVNARPRVRYRGDEPWQVTVTCDNEVRLQNSQAWTRMPITDMTLDYFKRIVSELKMEYDMGIRVY